MNLQVTNVRMLSERNKSAIVSEPPHIHICTFTLFIVKCTPCPAIPVAREEEGKEKRKHRKLYIYESVSN